MRHLRPVFWSETLSVGLRSVDDEHKLLLSIYNDLVTALRTGPDLPVVHRVVAEFTGYVRYHFDHEEELMATCSCPDLPAHRDEHQRLSHRLAVLADGLAHDRLDIPGLLDFAEDLVRGHFMGTDRHMAESLRRSHPEESRSHEFPGDGVPA